MLGVTAPHSAFRNPQSATASMETWRLLRGVGRPAENMARDLAMAWGVAQGLAPPTLRLYRWDPPALSIGYAQRGAAGPDPAACARAGLALVRRPTGGCAVLHAGDVTYAVALPRRGAWATAGVAATCRRIHEALAAGLRRLGVAAEVAGRQPGGAAGCGGATRGPARRRDEGAGWCFATLSAHEITVGGRKLVGSAQRRLRGAILQHGSIPLADGAERLGALAGAPALRALGESMVSLGELLGRPPDPDAVAAALAAGFAETLAARLAEEEWRPAERALAERLEACWGAWERGEGDDRGVARYLDTPGGVW